MNLFMHILHFTNYSQDISLFDSELPPTPMMILTLGK